MRRCSLRVFHVVVIARASSRDRLGVSVFLGCSVETSIWWCVGVQWYCCLLSRIPACVARSFTAGQSEANNVVMSWCPVVVLVTSCMRSDVGADSSGCSSGSRQIEVIAALVVGRAKM